MCGRYEVHTPIEDIARAFDAQVTADAAGFSPHYNVAPSVQVPVVRETKGGRRLEAMRWGLVPSWAKDPSGVRPINVRAETVFERPMSRNAVARRRCLIPADGFYEWQTGPVRKQPFHIGMAGGELFAFGGIWEYWAKEGSEPIVTCAIIVTRANELVSRIHARMPVIVPAERYAHWLDPRVGAREQIERVLEPFPAELMRAYPVSLRVNNVKNDGPELAAEVSTSSPAE